MPGAMPSGRLPPMPIRKVPMQDAAAVAVISERLVRSKQSRYPAVWDSGTNVSLKCPLHLAARQYKRMPPQLHAEAACTCVGGIELAARIPPGGAAAVVGRARAAAVCQDLGVHCQNVRHCNQQNEVVSRQLPFIQHLIFAVMIAANDMQNDMP
jgi:hypothetical protein